VRRDEEFERLAAEEGILRVLKLCKEIGGLFRVKMTKTTVMKVRYPKLLKSLPLVIHKQKLQHSSKSSRTNSTL
jgi:hypothetical protein